MPSCVRALRYVGGGAQVGDGRLADTPGFNQPSFEAITAADLPACFPEIRSRLGECVAHGLSAG
jgi:putative ribosome biogenesis GTPase RsgA